MTNPTRVEYGFGPLFAAIAAGPIFLTALMLGMGYASLPQAIPVDPDAPLVVLVYLIPATIVGILLAIIPCMIGCALMAHLGRIVPFMRLPPFWALAGMLPIVLGIAVTGFESEAAPAYFALLTTGAACALICRKFTCWEDATETAPTAPAHTTNGFHEASEDRRILR